MNITWKLWTNAATEAKARRVLGGLTQQLGLATEVDRIEPYAKVNGFVITFSVEMEAEDWAHLVLEALVRGQRVGYQWTLTGSADAYISATSDQSRVPGVVLLEWILERGDT